LTERQELRRVARLFLVASREKAPALGSTSTPVHDRFACFKGIVSQNVHVAFFVVERDILDKNF
jgi:hypothetical protein